MAATREQIVKKAQEWVGRKESNGTHKLIIDTYNSHKPLARGYAMKYTDAWCSCFVSAVAIACGATDIIPTEVGCEKHIQLFKNKGIWVENDAYVPSAGDIIFYVWDDSGAGDCTGSADHVGIVEKVANGYITVIEGNISDSVGRRTIAINGRFIRGFGVPKYSGKNNTTNVVLNENKISVQLNELSKGSKGYQVKTLQRLLESYGYSVGSSGIDGDFGSDTNKAVRNFQRARKLDVDGCVGIQTWGALLKG